MTKKNKIIISIVAVVLLTAAILGVFFSQKKDKKEYTMYTVSKNEPLTFTGNATASNTQSVFFDASKGEVVKYYVNDKDEIQAGTDLFMYENPVVKEQIEELQRQYNNMKKSLDLSNSDLSKANSEYGNAKNNVSDLENKINVLKNNKSENPEEIAKNQLELQQLKMEFEAAKQEVKAYEAQLSPSKRAVSEAQSQLDGLGDQIQSLKEKQFSTEKANISGIVYLNKDGYKESMTSPEPIVKIVSKDTKITSKISEFDYDKIRVDDRVDLRVLSTGETQKGTISSISNLPVEEMQVPGAPQGNNMSEYEFTVTPDGYIQYGFSVNVEISEDDLFIPSSAVQEEEGKTYIYKYEDGKAKRHEVSLMKVDEAYKVLKGLKLGDSIIEDVTDLSDGEEIDVRVEENKDDNTDNNKNNNGNNDSNMDSTDNGSSNVDNNSDNNNPTETNPNNPSETDNQKDEINDDTSQKG